MVIAWCFLWVYPNLAWAGEVVSPEEVPSQDVHSRAADSNVLANVDGGEITWADLDSRVGLELLQMEVDNAFERYDHLDQSLSAHIAERLLNQEVKRRDLQDIDELLSLEVESKVEPPNAVEIQHAFEANQDRFPDWTLGQAAPSIRQHLLNEGKMARFSEYVGELMKTSEVELFLPPLQLPSSAVSVNPSEVLAGPKDAPITVVEFAEYECPYCHVAKKTVDRVLEAYPNEVRFVFKDFPLPSHPRAALAANAVHCAGEQGKRFEMHQRLMDGGAVLSEESFVMYAGSMKMRKGPYKRCLEANKYESKIAESVAYGKDLGVAATPTFFINGIPLAGAQPFERFVLVIESERTKLSLDGSGLSER